MPQSQTCLIVPPWTYLVTIETLAITSKWQCWLNKAGRSFYWTLRNICTSSTVRGVEVKTGSCSDLDLQIKPVTELCLQLQTLSGCERFLQSVKVLWPLKKKLWGIKDCIFWPKCEVKAVMRVWDWTEDDKENHSPQMCVCLLLSLSLPLVFERSESLSFCLYTFCCRWTHPVVWRPRFKCSVPQT